MNRDRNDTASSEGQAKIASVPTAPSATDGLEKLATGYCAAIRAATAAETPRVPWICAWKFAAVTAGPPPSWFRATNSRHSS
ncbi:MAG: hypothetical protein ACRDNZ_17285 [Streptosporangiaceae bacterium]